MSQTRTGTTPPAVTRPVLDYDGTIGELYALFLKNLLLTVVTLGFYRFWAITSTRRYLWSHTRFEGTRFTYTGTGKELFLGFLIAMGLLFLVVSLIIGLIVGLMMIHPLLAILAIFLIIPLYVLLFILFGAARYSAQRYRLSRTEWRGLRGGMTGSALAYGLALLLYTLGVIFTLYQLVPWMQVSLARRRINASQFGAASFHFEGRGGTLYPAWLATLAGLLLLMGLVGGVCSALTWDALEPLMKNQLTGWRRDSALVEIGLVFLAGFFVFSLLGGFVAIWYWTRTLRLIMGNTALDGLRFSSIATPGGMFRLLIGNGLILLLTAGLGLPVVLHRSMRFLASTARMSGQIDPATLAQSSLARPRTGEGWLQMLDPGII